MNNVSKESLISLMKREYPVFKETKNVVSTFHLNWDDALPFLYFLHSVLAYDERRKYELYQQGKQEEFVDMFGLILIMRQVGLAVNPDKKFGFILAPLYSNGKSFWGWNPDNVDWNEYRNYLIPYSSFVSKTLKEIGILLGTIK